LLPLSKSAKLEGKVTTVVIQAASQSCNAEGLAGCSADEEVDCSIFILSDSGEVAVQRHVGVMVLKHGARELLDLREERRLPVHMVPCSCRSLNAAAH
jgi:hypothetical protein